MLEIVFIIGLTMAMTEALKSRLPKSLLFVPVIGLAAGLNALNALYFNGILVNEALAEGVRYGAMAGGVYGLGKKTLKGFVGRE